MGDLISRNELLNRLAAYGDSEKNTDYDNGWDDARDEIARIVKDAEAVDAVRVVRCKDCAFWRKEVSGIKHWVCIQHSFYGREMHTMPDFFCKDGRETW